MISARSKRARGLSRFIVGALVAIGLAQPATANRLTVEIAGARFTAASETSPKLPLRGVGLLRVGLFFDVYVAALYADRSKSAEALLSPEQPKELIIHYLRDIDREDIIEAAERHFNSSLSAGERDRIDPQLARWHDAMRSVRTGDRYSMRYDGARISLRLNGELLTEIETPELARAYFGIWLDENSLAPDLRRRLLALTEAD